MSLQWCALHHLPFTAPLGLVVRPGPYSGTPVENEARHRTTRSTIHPILNPSRGVGLRGQGINGRNKPSEERENAPVATWAGAGSISNSSSSRSNSTRPSPILVAAVDLQEQLRKMSLDILKDRRAGKRTRMSASTWSLSASSCNSRSHASLCAPLCQLGRYRGDRERETDHLEPFRENVP